jgi:hypothetical protein
MTPMQTDRERKRQSERILDRVQQDAGRDALGVATRTASRVRRHVGAADADQDDRIEVIGTRIGRVLGLFLTAVLIALFLWYLIDG